jgi:dTDP-4-dehydrorhamnose reductase
MGEVFTSNYSSKGIVIRISGIYGKVPSLMKGNNFITMILQVAEEKEEIKVVTDEILSPTPTEEIAKKTLNIVGRGEPGIYHLACEGQCSWFEFTRVIFDTLGITKPLLPTTSKEFGSQVKRPKFSVLENRHYNTLFPNDPMPHWKDALINFLNKNYRRNQL